MSGVCSHLIPDQNSFLIYNQLHVRLTWNMVFVGHTCLPSLHHLWSCRWCSDSFCMLQLLDTVTSDRCWVSACWMPSGVVLTKTSDMWPLTLLTVTVAVPLYIWVAFDWWSNGGCSEQQSVRLTRPVPRPSLPVLRPCPCREGHHGLNGLPHSPHKGTAGWRPLQWSGNMSDSHRRRFEQIWGWRQQMLRSEPPTSGQVVDSNSWSC